MIYALINVLKKYVKFHANLTYPTPFFQSSKIYVDFCLTLSSKPPTMVKNQHNSKSIGYVIIRKERRFRKYHS